MASRTPPSARRTPSTAETTGQRRRRARRARSRVPLAARAARAPSPRALRREVPRRRRRTRPRRRAASSPTARDPRSASTPVRHQSSTTSGMRRFRMPAVPRLPVPGRSVRPDWGPRRTRTPQPVDTRAERNLCVTGSRPAPSDVRSSRTTRGSAGTRPRQGSRRRRRPPRSPARDWRRPAGPD